MWTWAHLDDEISINFTRNNSYEEDPSLLFCSLDRMFLPLLIMKIGSDRIWNPTRFSISLGMFTRYYDYYPSSMATRGVYIYTVIYHNQVRSHFSFSLVSYPSRIWEHEQTNMFSPLLFLKQSAN